MTTTADPKCPDCGIQGISNIVSQESVERAKSRQPWFVVVHCKSCGHVYNVVAKHVFSQPTSPNFVLPKKL